MNDTSELGEFKFSHWAVWTCEWCRTRYENDHAGRNYDPAILVVETRETYCSTACYQAHAVTLSVAQHG